MQVTVYAKDDEGHFSFVAAKEKDKPVGILEVPDGSITTKDDTGEVVLGLRQGSGTGGVIARTADEAVHMALRLPHEGITIAEGFEDVDVDDVFPDRTAGSGPVADGVKPGHEPSPKKAEHLRKKAAEKKGTKGTIPKDHVKKA